MNKQPSPRLLALLTAAYEDHGIRRSWLADQAGYTPAQLSNFRRERPPGDLDRLFRLIDAARGTGEDRDIILRELAEYDAEQREKKAEGGVA